jgi:hypothetical protein
MTTDNPTPPPAGYVRRKCSQCGEDLSFSESDPCDKCSDAAELAQPVGVAGAECDLLRVARRVMRWLYANMNPTAPVDKSLLRVPQFDIHAELEQAILNASARRRAPQPATAPNDERLMVHESTGVVGCNDSRCPVGATINGWPHPFNTPDCIYAATVATPTDVAERARRTTTKLFPYLRMLGKDELERVADIIAAKFK